MAAPLGNDYNKKYKTSEERKALCDKFCEHIRQGFTKQSFTECDHETFDTYREKYPDDFDSKKIKDAYADNRKKFETIGMQGMTGQIKDFNPTTWIFWMKNRFRESWRDSYEQKHEVTGLDGISLNIVTSPKNDSGNK